jgi:DNA-binding beta-propeller fold protein YncE
VGAVVGLAGASSVAATPDGANVYVAGAFSRAVAAFAVNR